MSKDNYVDFVHLSLPVRAWDDVQKRITALEELTDIHDTLHMESKEHLAEAQHNKLNNVQHGLVEPAEPPEGMVRTTRDEKIVNPGVYYKPAEPVVGQKCNDCGQYVTEDCWCKHFEPAEPDRCIVCDCILTSYEGDVCRSHEPAKPAMEEWIEVDGKMYGTSAAPDHIEDDLVEELRNRIEAQDTLISAMTHRLRFMENL